jgi:subtilisin family serine protease
MTANRRILTAVLGLTVLAAAAPAASAADDDGLWYYTGSGMAELHQQTRGEGVTIAILDSQINASIPDLAGADLQIHEPSYCAETEGGPALPATTTESRANHGTGVASVLVGTGAGIAGQPGVLGVAPEVTIRYYAFGISLDQTVGNSTPLKCPVPAGFDVSESTTSTQALRQAVADGADIISVSSSTFFSTAAIAEAQRAGVILVTGAGNIRSDTFTALAQNNGVVVVGSITSALQPWEDNPYGPELSVNAPGVDIRTISPDFTGYGTASGSSLAAPYTAGALALSWSVHPDATANQMIQALLRTTGGQVHDLDRDDVWGYGIVHARALVAIDPTTLPDENPLLTDGPDREPTRAEVLGTATDESSETPSAAPTTTPSPTTAPLDEETADGGLPIGLIGGGIALIAVLLVLTVVLLRRRPNDSDQNDVTGDHHGYQG